MYQQQAPDIERNQSSWLPGFSLCFLPDARLCGHGFLVKHHWHEEAEILYFPGGTFSLDINMETFDVSDQNVFISLIPANCTASVLLPKKSCRNMRLSSSPELLCSPFYDTVQTQLIQPLQNGQLHFPRSISKEHPAFSCSADHISEHCRRFFPLQLRLKL